MFLLGIGCATKAEQRKEPPNAYAEMRAQVEREAAMEAREPSAALDDPSAESPPPSAAPSDSSDNDRFRISETSFSGFVAGVPLWVDIATTAKGCNGPKSQFGVMTLDGKVLPAAEARHGDMMVCMNPAVDPFLTHNVTEVVMLTLCDSPAGLIGCDANLMFKKNDFEAATSLLDQLTEKYGAGTSGEVPFSCSGPLDRKRQFKRIWYVPLELEDGERLVYRIVFGWTCEPATGPRKPGILFVYQTPTEIERRFRQTRERRDSF